MMPEYVKNADWDAPPPRAVALTTSVVLRSLSSSRQACTQEKKKGRGSPVAFPGWACK